MPYYVINGWSYNYRIAASSDAEAINRCVQFATSRKTCAAVYLVGDDGKPSKLAVADKDGLVDPKRARQKPEEDPPGPAPRWMPQPDDSDREAIQLAMGLDQMDG